MVCLVWRSCWWYSSVTHEDALHHADQEVLTPEVLTSWCTEATNHASLHAMRKLVKVNFLLMFPPCAVLVLPCKFLPSALF